MSKNKTPQKKIDIKNAEVLGKEAEGLTLIQYKSNGTVVRGFIDNNGNLLEHCPELDANEIVNNFNNGYSIGGHVLNKDKKTSAIMSHRRTILGTTKGVYAIAKLADLVYEDPYILLEIQNEIALIDQNVFDFLLDIVRYKFLDNLKDLIANGRSEATDQIDITTFKQKVKENFQKLEKEGLLTYEGLIENFDNLERGDQRKLGNARSYALDKYYIDLFDIDAINSNLEEDRAKLEEFPLDDIPTAQISSNDFMNFNFMNDELARVKLRIDCHHSEVHQFWNTLNEILLASNGEIEKISRDNTTDLTRFAINSLMEEKLTSLAGKAENYINKLSPIHDNYERLMQATNNEIEILKEVINAYLGIKETKEKEETPKTFSLFD